MTNALSSKMYASQKNFMIKIFYNKYDFELRFYFFKKMSLTQLRAPHYSVDSAYILHENNAKLDVAKFKSINLVCNSVVLVHQKKFISPKFYNYIFLYFLKIFALKNESHLKCIRIFFIRHITAFSDQCDN